MPVQPFSFSKKTPPAPSSPTHDLETGRSAPVQSTPIPQQVAATLPATVEAGFPDPYKLLADCRKLSIFKEVTGRSRAVNCVLGLCGVTRFHYFIRDAITGKDLFKAKLSYNASLCNVCSGGTRHNYSLDIFCLPLNGSTVVGREGKGAFLAASSSATSQVASGGHGVMDLRTKETVGRVIPAPSGSLTVKEGASGATAFRIAIPINVGFGGNTSEMQVEDATTTALVGRLIKTWTKGDSDWTNICCCSFGNEVPGSFLLDMAAVANIKKRALLVVAAILADGVAFSFKAAPPVGKARPPANPEKTRLLEDSN